MSRLIFPEMILSLLINPLSLYGEINLTTLSEMSGLFGMGSRKDAREMHRDEGMPDNIRRNRNRGRDAGDAG